MIWRAPSGHVYVTTPGSALLFPTLCTPTGDIVPPDPDGSPPCGDHTAMMPKRRHTRSQNRARYITAERKHNREARQARKAARQAAVKAKSFSRTPAGANPDNDPPPF